MKVSPEVLEKARHVGWLTALGTWSTGVIIEAVIDSLPEPESADEGIAKLKVVNTDEYIPRNDEYIPKNAKPKAGYKERTEELQHVMSMERCAAEINALKAENERLKAQVEPLDNENTCLSAQLGELNQELLRAHAENEKHEEREKVLLVLLGRWYRWSDVLWDSAVEKGSLLASETRAALAEKEKEKA